MSMVLKRRASIARVALCMIMVLTLSLFMNNTTAYAATSSEVATELGKLSAVATSTDGSYTTEQTNKAAKKMESILTSYGTTVNGVNYIILGTIKGSPDKTGKITYNSKTYTIAVYDKTSADTFVTVVKEAVSDCTELGSVASTKDQITNAIDVKADIDGAADTLSGLQPFITQILGLICYVAIVAMAVFTAFDICYITMPVFRGKVETKAAGGGFGTRESKATGERKLAVITDDAIQAVEEGANTGKKPLVIYLKKRIGSYIAIAVVIYMLMSGNIALLVSLALKAVSGAMQQLQTLAN